MINCREVMEKLADYLAGKLASEMSQQINWHMGHCPRCKQMLRSAQRTLRESFAAAAHVSGA